ncbi:MULTISPECIES: hydrogenase maturation nickel metallochaperone HypA [Haloferax]|uniref:Hydrogenase maturation nickel metallochaperone HypA n=2 Tax=Haloferax TaxID=2251 RepID=A0A6G1Z2L1_9EURY|nr:MULTISPECIES: hydrogenase maturation nickel metallochaperone HypA [Haloferax]KAB1188188.1 hydrogenase maturation nickel metallochaperone HypA [Haloferax sp. CBA1149]MRW80867.1 hypothetical protein [Haloferax marinisediminis]
MEIRGERECKECGRQWSYYETGSVSCPYCGSLRSVGVGDRERHTAGQAVLDLSEHRAAVANGTFRDAAPALKSDLRAYIRKTGYIHGGELLPLDDTSLAAHELLHAVDVVARSNRPTDDEQLFVLDLLREADEGIRPDMKEVPKSLTDARGLGYANAIEAYHDDLTKWLDDHPDPEARTTLETLSNHLKRVDALEGDISLNESEALVGVARDIYTYLTDDDLDALASARDQLSALF